MLVVVVEKVEEGIHNGMVGVMVMETEVAGTMKEVVVNVELVMAMVAAVASKIWEMVAAIQEVVVM